MDPQGHSGKDQNDKIKALTANSYNLEASSAVPVKELAEPESKAAVFEQLSDDIWKQIVQNIRQENNSLAALLRDARPMSRDGNFVTLGVKFAFHKDKISEPDYLKVIEAEIKKFTGNDWKVKCEIADIKKKPAKPASEEEMAAAAEEIFNS